MSTRSITIQNATFVLLLALALTAIVYQSVVNRGHYKDGKRAVKDAYRHDEFPHPMLIWRPYFHGHYARALHEIDRSPHKTFWLISQDLDVMMMMNYFAYPKELRTSLETQRELEKRHYEKDYMPFTQLPPKAPYEQEIYTHFRESTFD